MPTAGCTPAIIAVMDDDQYVSIVGRIKDMIIRGGENIYPREVEEFLYSHPDIVDVQVIGVPDEKYGEELVAWVRLREGATMTRDDLAAFCAGRIAHFKIPRYLHVDRRVPDDCHREGSEVPNARGVDRAALRRLNGWAATSARDAPAGTRSPVRGLR